jgi:hypothetical protein
MISNRYSPLQGQFDDDDTKYSNHQEAPNEGWNNDCLVSSDATPEQGPPSFEKGSSTKGSKSRIQSKCLRLIRKKKNKANNGLDYPPTTGLSDTKVQLLSRKSILMLAAESIGFPKTAGVGSFGRGGDMGKTSSPACALKEAD